MRTDERATYADGFDEDVQQNEHNTCPECKGRVTTNTHETVCDDCGLVLSESAIDHGPEWRSFDRDAKKRTGAPRTAARHDKGLSTVMGFSGNDVKGASQRRRRQLDRLRTHHRRSKYESKRDRNRAKAFGEVRRMIGALGLKGIHREQSCSLFKQAQDADLIRGRSLEAMASASVYASCRCNGLPRTLAEVASVSRVPAHKVQNSYDALNRELGLPTAVIEPTAYVPRIASEVDAPTSVERRARELVRRAVEVGFTTGCNPVGVAGGGLLVAADEQGERITQRAVAGAADVAVVTVRNRRDDLLALRE